MQKLPFTIITGASEGLGKFLALECAQRGMNLILVSLPGTGLSYLAASIRMNYNVQVEYVELDLSETRSCYLLEEELRKMPVSINILINNAGIGGTHSFDEKAAAFYERQIQLNVLCTTLITRLFIPHLSACKSSHILNVGSLASFFTMPFKQVYAGTKAYIYFFSRSLHHELSHKGISVSVLCPGGINSNPAMILKNRKMGWLAKRSVMSPESIARFAVDGMLKRKAVVIPGRVNRLFLLFNRCVPGHLRNYLVRKEMEQFKCPKGNDWMEHAA